MRILAAAALLSVASCSDGLPDAEQSKTHIEKLLRQYHEAYDRADADAVVAMLDPDVSISDPPHGFLRGKDKCGESLTKGMARLKENGLVGKRTTLFGPIQVDVTGATAVATYVAMVREDRAQSNTIFTRIFRHRKEGWLILTEHFTFEPVR